MRSLAQARSGRGKFKAIIEVLDMDVDIPQAVITRSGLDGNCARGP
jgi:hypothetical protein